MAEASKSKSKKHIPGSDAHPSEIFDFAFLIDPDSCEFINSHGRLMFILRGPPGTAKSTLSNLIMEKYESAAFCSADNYFETFCVKKMRNRETLKDSHNYCKNKVIEECEDNAHPIIVQNTHMKKVEVQPYIDLANKYGYTIIMAITTRKMEADPKILAKTNRKGLTEEYFRKRLTAWHEISPSYLGWFLSVNDSSYLLNAGKEILSSLLGDGTFCSTFQAFSEENIWDYFFVRPNLSCIAAYNTPYRREWYFYLSDNVQDDYGKSFLLKICGYLITKSCFSAVVIVPPEGKKLISNQDDRKRNQYDLCHAFESMGVKQMTDSILLKSFNEEFDNDGTVITESKNLDELNINDLCLMPMGSHRDWKVCKNANKFLTTVFGKMVDDKGNIDLSDYLEMDNDTKYHRLPNDIWFVHAPEEITVNSVFTGQYF